MSTTLNTITLTKKAEEKVKEILLDQPETFAGLRIQVVGGGCSGFQYRMGFDKNFNDQNDTVFEFDGLKVFIDKSRVFTAPASSSTIPTSPAVAAAAVRLASSHKITGGALKAERLKDSLLGDP